MSYVFCDACGAGFHSNALSCPDCGAPASRVQQRRASAQRARSVQVREDVEPEVRNALYGRRSGTVEQVSGV
jgi:predicted amidophosphoribosyltransferase